MKVRQPTGCKCCEEPCEGNFCESCGSMIKALQITAHRRPLTLKRILRFANIWPYKKLGVRLA